MKVTINLDDVLLDVINKRLPWLCYSPKDFVREAILHHFEDLLQISTLPLSSHVLQFPQTVADSHKQETF